MRADADGRKGESTTTACGRVKAGGARELVLGRPGRALQIAPQGPCGGTEGGVRAVTGYPFMARRMYVWVLGVAVALLSVVFDAHPSAAQADVALVMAVDVSSSVNDKRFQLQREGIAEGLQSRAVLDALAAGPRQTIELAIVEWSEEQQLLVDWTIIHGPVDLEAVVHALRTRTRPHVGWKTNIGGGIAKAIALFDSAPLRADRKVIDVSGDGEQNYGHISADRARDAALAKGITINGLPITSGDEPEVDRWYKANVIGGEGAFMIVANGHENFSDAMRKKLALEVAGLTPTVWLAAVREAKPATPRELPSD